MGRLARSQAVTDTLGWIIGAAISAGSVAWARAFMHALRRK